MNRVGELIDLLEMWSDPKVRSRYLERSAFLDLPVEGTTQGANFIAFEHVTFYNPAAQLIVKDLSFKMESKNILIMGPSGCGKSSILRVLAGSLTTVKCCV